MTDPETLKRNVAREAVRNINNNETIGLGSGSTIRHLIEEISKRIKSEGLRILAIPTSYDSMLLASENGIRLTTLEEHPNISKCFDGADKVDRDLNMIKGGGGCHTREKIIASASETLCILIDHTKLIDKLTGDLPIPVEIIPFSYKVVSRKIKEVGGTLRLRSAGSLKLGPLIGDNGGFIGDVTIPGNDNLKKLDNLLNSTPGLIEHGLFIEMADLVYVAHEKKVEILRRTR